MSPHPNNGGNEFGPELVIGLVGAIGADLAMVSESLQESLTAVRYSCEVIRLSELLQGLKPSKIGQLCESPLHQRYDSYMTAGNNLRELLERGDAMALLGVGAVRENRAEKGEDPNDIRPRQAYLLRSLKHPEEVKTLRRIYGPAFILLAAYAARDMRVQNLARRIAESEHRFQSQEFRAHSEQLVQRDEAELGKKFGQNVREVFPLADMFIDVNDPGECHKSMMRIVELLFGNTFHTPTKDEYGMFHAEAAALRSASLQRQVGAAIATTEGDIIAVGTNEVPKAGGGLYWCDDIPDHRDFHLGYETNDRLKRRMLADVLNRLRKKGWLADTMKEEPVDSLLAQALASDDASQPDEAGPMKGAQLMNIIEFGRCVHAEMAALMDAARRGASIASCTLYSTTFPCHECARHIVAAGISRVVYVEPYPKSLVPELYPDSISVDGGGQAGEQVRFEPFVGVAPRRYFDLFRSLGRRDKNGNVIRWSSSLATPRLGEYPSPPTIALLTTEEKNFDEFIGQLEAAGLK